MTTTLRFAVDVDLLEDRLERWAERLFLSELDQLAASWRDESFPGRANLRDQVACMILEQGLANPFAGLRSDLGHALSDMACVAILATVGVVPAGDPLWRLAQPVAVTFFHGDLSLAMEQLTTA